MIMSEKIDELAKALCAFQAEMPKAGKDGVNPFFSGSYITLETLLATATPKLTEHGLAVSQVACGMGSVTTILMHTSGQYISGNLTLTPEKDTPQGAGSAITYARRYSYSAITGVVADVDDDANAATPSANPKNKAKPGAKGEKPKDAPPKKETATDKDARHKAELIAIIGHIAGKDKDPKGRAKSLIIEWTEYTEDGESKCLDSIRDPQDPTRKAWHPKLKGKWLNMVLAKARPAYTIWLGASPGEESKVAKVTKGAK